MSIILVDPTASSQTTTFEIAARPIGSEHTVVALLDSGKPNADRILQGVKESLGNVLTWSIGVERFVKPHASRIVPTHLVNQIVRRCHFAIVGVGD